jgi:hypothetical protein
MEGAQGRPAKRARVGNAAYPDEGGEEYPLLPDEIVFMLARTIDAASFHPFRMVCRQWNCMAEARRLRVAYSYANRDRVTYARVLAEAGDLALLRWAHANGCPVDDPWATKAAASTGRLDILSWLVQRGCPMDVDIFHAAARRGHLHVLRWLRDAGCAYDERATVVAAEGGHVDVLEWLTKECGIPLHMATCSYAASRGHLDALKWLRAHGAPWGPYTFFEAAVRGHVDVLDWAHANGCPPYAGDPWKAVVASNKVACLEWAHSKGFPFSDRMRAYAQSQLISYKWLHARGYA